MKKFLVFACCILFILCGCGNKDEDATSYTCTYGEKGDDFYMNIIINYDNDVVKKMTFNQYVLSELQVEEGETIDDVEDAYEDSMDNISGITSDATTDGDYIHYNYTVNMSEYNSESDVMGVIISDALDDNGNTNQAKLRKYLESDEMGYKCE